MSPQRPAALSTACLAAGLLLGAASAGAREPGLELSLTHRMESLSNNTPDWRETGMQLDWLRASRTSVNARLSEVERFGLRDTSLALGGYLPLGERLTGFAEVVKNQNHTVLARHSAQAQLQRALDGGWGLTGGLKLAQYNTTDVSIIDLGVERYFGNWRAAFTWLPSRSDTAGSANAFHAQLSRYYGDRSSMNLVFGDGEEVDRVLAAAAPVRTQVTSLELYGRHWFAPSWAMEYGGGQTRFGAITRRTLGLGLRYRF